MKEDLRIAYRVKNPNAIRYTHDAIRKKRGAMKSTDQKIDLTGSIKEKARELWEKDGRKQGCDLQYWLKAEKIVKSQSKKW